jgi:hypothetical protein
LQGPAGFVASNYLPTLASSSATRETNNPLGDYSWATNPGSTASINFSFVSLPQGRYTMTIVAQDAAGTTITSNAMTFEVFVKVPTVTATTVAGKIDSVDRFRKLAACHKRVKALEDGLGTWPLAGVVRPAPARPQAGICERTQPNIRPTRSTHSCMRPR